MPGGNRGDVYPFLLVVGRQVGLEKLQNLAAAIALNPDILDPLTATSCLSNLSISKTVPAWKVSGVHWESISFHMAVICC